MHFLNAEGFYGVYPPGHLECSIARVERARTHRTNLHGSPQSEGKRPGPRRRRRQLGSKGPPPGLQDFILLFTVLGVVESIP